MHTAEEGNDLDVELGPSPVTTLGVVLKQGEEVELQFKTKRAITHLDLSVGLQAEPLGNRPSKKIQIFSPRCFFNHGQRQHTCFAWKP